MLLLTMNWRTKNTALILTGLRREFRTEGTFRHAFKIPRIRESVRLQRLRCHIRPKIPAHQSWKAARTSSALVYRLWARVSAEANTRHSHEVS